MQDKCLNFAVRVVNLCDFLNKEKKEFKIADQLYRSGTSIGAVIHNSNIKLAQQYIVILNSNIKRKK